MKKRKITTRASDGREFFGYDYESLMSGVDTYETDLKLKEQKEETERKNKEEAKQYRYNQVLDKLDSLNKVVESYEKETGEKLYYITTNGKVGVKTYGDYFAIFGRDFLKYI